MFSAATFSAISTGLQVGGTLGSAATGIMQAVYARKQATYAGRAVKRQAEIQAYSMRQEAMDNLVMADYTASQTLLEAQQAQDIGTMRANIVRAQTRKQMGSARTQAAAQGTETSDPGMIMDLADQAYEGELAAISEKYQGEYIAWGMETEAELGMYKARIGMSAARRGQQRLLEGANAQANNIQRQANQQFVGSLVGGLFGGSNLSNMLSLLRPRSAGAVSSYSAAPSPSGNSYTLGLLRPSAPDTSYFTPINTNSPLGL
jgi:hypothetical protein